ncbi:J domain-containing protein [Ancylobacter dichloromethanicus]|uniref:J domain-containing protein n=1 Tax=Ancylobacter dichloromethanicus TaxID=518825 RepID=UPI00360E7A9B
MEPGASLEAVKAAYRRAARESHPDLAASGEPFNSTPVREETREVARFVVLSDAYRVLEAEHVPVSLRRQEASLD